MQTGVEGQSLNAEDQLFVLLQAGLYLIATRGFSAPQVRICYERAESLCRLLNRPLVLFSSLEGQWRYSLYTDKLSATMQIAKRAYLLAQEQHDSVLMIGAYRAFAVTLFFLGDFESARQYAMRGLQIWRPGGVQSPVEEISAPAVLCLCIEAVTEWHVGAIASCQATVAEAISIAKELNDMHGLAVALQFAGYLGHLERNPAEVERLASDLIELSTRQNFALWLPQGGILCGWARSASGDSAEGIAWIENGIRDYRTIGAMLCMPYYLSLKAEALHLADRTSEALETIKEAERLAETSGERCCSAELYRLRGVFLTTIGADETQIKAAFCEAIRTAKQQKSISLAKRAEATHAEYRCQKARCVRGHGFQRLLC